MDNLVLCNKMFTIIENNYIETLFDRAIFNSNVISEHLRNCEVCSESVYFYLSRNLDIPPLFKSVVDIKLKTFLNIKNHVNISDYSLTKEVNNESSN